MGGTGYGLRDAVIGSDVRVWCGRYDAPAILRVIRANKTKVTLADGSEWTRSGREWGGSRDVWGRKSAAIILDLAAVQAEIAAVQTERRLEDLRRSVRHRCNEEARRLPLSDLEAIITILDAANKQEGG